MTDVTTTPDAERAASPRRALDRLGSPGLLFGVGLVTFAAALAVLLGWGAVYRDARYAMLVCGASSPISPALGWVVAVGGTAALVTLAGSTLLLAFRIRRRARALVAFWLAVVLTWVVIGAVLRIMTLAVTHYCAARGGGL